MPDTVQFSDLVPIDITRLDEEWLQHPILYHDLAQAAEDAEYAAEVAKVNFDTIEAELSLEIREDPDKFGAPASKTGSPTEGTVNSIIRMQPRYIKANKELLHAEHILRKLKVDLRTLDNRKTAMEELVKLHGQDYFSSPRGEFATKGIDSNEARARMRSALIQERRRQLKENADGQNE